MNTGPAVALETDVFNIEMDKELDLYTFYDSMEKSNILLSFKGEITSDLLTSILQIIESKLDNFEEKSKTRKKVYNVLVECLQNLYHHVDEISPEKNVEATTRSAIFMIGKDKEKYNILTGNFILTNNIAKLTERMDKINSLSLDELKSLYREILNNDQFSDKGGGGLGLVDIARRTGQPLGYSFKEVGGDYSFFTMSIKISHVS
jgi:hypothetical protein